MAFTTEFLVPALKILAKAMLEESGKQAVINAVEAVKQMASDAGIALRNKDVSLMKRALNDDPGKWLRFIATLNLFPEDGVVLVGPSGAGKTVIYNYLTRGIIAPSGASTEVREKRRTTGGGKKFGYVDTPGAMYHVALEKELYRYLRSKRPKIVAVVLAYGYLSNVDTKDALLFEASRGEKEYASVPDYQKEGLKEEEKWLLTVAGTVSNTEFKASSLMIVINKQDLWGAPNNDAMSYYSNPGSIRQAIEMIRKSWCSENCQPTFHSVASLYDSFKGKKSPVGSLSIKLAEESLRVLRAVMRLKLLGRM